MFLVLNGQAEEFWEPSHKQRAFGKKGESFINRVEPGYNVIEGID